MTQSFFDPKSFVAGGFLDAQVCDITSVKATKFDYNGKVDPPANVVEIEYTRSDGKTRTEIYGTGASVATEDGNNVDKQLNKGCKFAQFIGYLAKTKYPIANLQKDGLSALVGHRFVMKNAPQQGKDFFVPDTYVGIADGNAEAAQAEEDTLRDLVGTLILSVAREAGGSVKKTALTQKLGAKLADQPEVKGRAITLALTDSFLAALPGVNYEKGTITLIAE